MATHRFDMAQACFITSALTLSVLLVILERRRVFVANAELVEENWKGPPKFPPPSMRVIPFEVRGGDVRVDNVAQRRCSVALALEEVDHLEVLEVVEAQITYLLPERDVSSTWPVRLTKSLPAPLLARLCVTFGTVSPYPVLGELRTRDPHPRQSHSSCPGRPARDILSAGPEEMMELQDLARVSPRC